MMFSPPYAIRTCSGAWSGGEPLDQDWHLMCPHDILMVKGYALEDSYGEEWEPSVP